MRTQGVINPTLDTILSFVLDPMRRYRWHFALAPPDAAVDRARSMAATHFLQRTENTVLVMLDYDVSLPRASSDLEYLAEKAHQTTGIVGAIVSKKSEGSGFGGRFVDDEDHELYANHLVELGEGQYVGGACTAYHRKVFERMIASGIQYCPAQGFWPFFLPTITFSEELQEYEYLSEDWAICKYARETGSTVHAAMKPVTIHHGRKGYSALEGNA
jgi:hypothetical protein